MRTVIPFEMFFLEGKQVGSSDVRQKYTSTVQDRSEGPNPRRHVRSLVSLMLQVSVA